MNLDDLDALFVLRRYIIHRLDEKFNYGDLIKIQEFVDDASAFIQERYNVYVSSTEINKRYPLKSKKDREHACHLIYESIDGDIRSQTLLAVMAYFFQISRWLKFDITKEIDYSKESKTQEEETKVVVNSIKDDKMKEKVESMLTVDNENSKIRSGVLNIDDKKSNTDEYIDKIFPENK